MALVLLVLFRLSGCREVTGGSNYALTTDSPLDGTLFMCTQNTALVECASVDGSVLMLCCNLTLEVDVNQAVIFLMGNLSITSSADVACDVTIPTGNVFQQQI